MAIIIDPFDTFGKIVKLDAIGVPISFKDEACRSWAVYQRRGGYFMLCRMKLVRNNPYAIEKDRTTECSSPPPKVAMDYLRHSSDGVFDALRLG